MITGPFACIVSIIVMSLGCGRLGFDSLPPEVPDGSVSTPDGTVSPDAATSLTSMVCHTGCTYSTIQAAIDHAVADPDPMALPIVIEVRDDSPYVGDLVITTPISRVPVTLRAAPGSWPVLSGTGGSNTAVLSISASNITVSGFTFEGTAQRGIAVSSPHVTIDHNFFGADFGMWNADQFFRGTGILLSGAGTDGARISNNTFYDCQESIEVVDAPTPGNAITLRDNIFVQLTENRPDYEPILWFKPSVAYYALDSNYNLFYYTGSECIAWDDSTGPITTIAAWRAQGNDRDGIGTGIDPLLADPVNHDFHERSTGGRYRPGTGWVIDTVNSAAVDHGDPLDPLGAEPPPNGGLVNLGGYGGTVQASHTP